VFHFSGFRVYEVVLVFVIAAGRIDSTATVHVFSAGDEEGSGGGIVFFVKTTSQ
jgi:hypothetical protein